MKYDEEGRLIVPKFETKKEKRDRVRRWKQNKFDSYQEESLKNATNNLQKYKDSELKEILECGSEDYDKMMQLATKFKRRWWAIKTIIEDRDYYKKHGINKLTIRNDSFGKQLQMVMEND